MSTLLSIQHVIKTYPNGHTALRDISFDVQEGDFIAIIGLSGSGKSTLLRCINRMHDVTSGKILFRGKDITDLQGEELRKHRQECGMIFQHFNLVKRRSVMDNVLSGMLGSASIWRSILGQFTEEDRARALSNLEIVGIAEKAPVRADALSGGQQQRVAIARALMQDPSIILADEPVASLDPATSHSVMNYLEAINKKLGKTVLCNLHFMSLVRRYATRAIALKDGIIVFDGDPQEITDARFKEIYGEDAVEVEIR
ncbi:MAG: phosphonate ABC transporter ATP-binding protein [Ignavibacteria bacterium]|jgi:phosphonate transport system ATP-binding protein